MANNVTGPETGVKYILQAWNSTDVGYAGHKCVFNDPSDSDYVGGLSNISGLDSPEVRTQTIDLVEDHGSAPARAWFGGRSIVLEGWFPPTSSAAARNQAIAKVRGAVQALADPSYEGMLTFYPSGYTHGGSPATQRIEGLRLSSPFRVSGGFNKTFSISLVADDPRIYGNDYQQAYWPTFPAPDEYAHNGNTEALPRIIWNGIDSGDGSYVIYWGTDVDDPEKRNVFSFNISGDLPLDGRVVVDSKEKLVTVDGEPINHLINFESSDWPKILPNGTVTEFRMTPEAPNELFAPSVLYFDTWI